MKREDLRALFENGEKSVDDKINAIMDMNGNDINNARASFKVDESKWVSRDSYTELETKYNNQTNEFTAYKNNTKDYEDIKGKYNNMLQEQEKNSKLDVLKGMNCKHPDLLVGQIDWNKYNKETKEFDKEYIDGFKGKYADLFQIEEKKYSPNKSKAPGSYYDPNQDKKWTDEELRKL